MDTAAPMDTGYDRNTGYYLVGNLIWGPREPGAYRIEADGSIHGPGCTGTYWIGAADRIYGPGESGRFRIENGRIWGPGGEPPWMREARGIQARGHSSVTSRAAAPSPRPRTTSTRTLAISRSWTQRSAVGKPARKQSSPGSAA
jgi:hypothetical protein